ncbi:hypothetical protein ES332_A03G031700v1 [Gossypium tomentosum]|uniref:Uncharacterized protein n=1 Tax=Gossypium tomentosum TaxID=34277 RepID=A0A5D2R3A7_GOSTO|nr:hypothetical protein ES332_A03G031700v1 [Gossypium tomentosum]
MLDFLVARACNLSGGFKWRVLREAGFTEQRRPLSLYSGRITSLIHSDPTLLSELTLTGPSSFLVFCNHFPSNWFCNI